MDLPNILNSKGPAAVADHQLQQHFTQIAQANGRSYSDTGSERGISPHTSDHSSRYSSHSTQPLNSIPNMANTTRFQSPPNLQQPLPMLPNGFLSQNGGNENSYGHVQQHGNGQEQDQQHAGSNHTEGGAALKAFACNSCGKGFARRSDLARHGMKSIASAQYWRTNFFLTERIHTGVRPHVCDYPGCNKQFIQRSALTVHARVHTGEKPHMCERCGKVTLQRLVSLL